MTSCLNSSFSFLIYGMCIPRNSLTTSFSCSISRCILAMFSKLNNSFTRMQSGRSSSSSSDLEASLAYKSKGLESQDPKAFKGFEFKSACLCMLKSLVSSLRRTSSSISLLMSRMKARVKFLLASWSLAMGFLMYQLFCWMLSFLKKERAGKFFSKSFSSSSSSFSSLIV